MLEQYLDSTTSAPKLGGAPKQTAPGNEEGKIEKRSGEMESCPTNPYWIEKLDGISRQAFLYYRWFALWLLLLFLSPRNLHAGFQARSKPPAKSQL